jgi:hypothetical protein
VGWQEARSKEGSAKSQRVKQVNRMQLHCTRKKQALMETFNKLPSI